MRTACYIVPKKKKKKGGEQLLAQTAHSVLCCCLCSVSITGYTVFICSEKVSLRIKSK